ncbi:MAG TPA: hypothetical protein VKZ53_10755 [Candidatus Angelobacter sp.]|nr:hypothetical protein [Candidatus Angelobacter sp.]
MVLPIIRDAYAWIVAGPALALARLSVLASAHRSHRPVLEVGSLQEAIPHLNHAAGVLLVGGMHRSLSDLPGVFLEAPNGRRVPVGWLPDVGGRLETYAHAAAQVQLRCGQGQERGPLALLGENGSRYLDLTGKIRTILEDTQDKLALVQWTAERIVRRDLVKALGVGLGAAIYCGHGVAAGWVGYGGFDGDDAAAACGNPIGAVLSIACSVSAGSGALQSFSENLALSGLCAAAFGAVQPTLHERNVELALALSAALQSPAIITLADLVSASGIPADGLESYRIAGDPLAPLLGDAGAMVKARAVFAPAPNDILPVVPLSSWAAMREGS